MTAQLGINPNGKAAFAAPVELVGPTRTVSVRLAFRWMPRIARWSVKLTTPDRSVDLSLEQLVTPSGDLLFDVRDVRCPEGRLSWSGPDPYRKTDLGRLVNLTFTAAAS